MTTRRGFLAGGSAAILAGAAPRSAWAHTQADVTVIGAGLSGVAAARMLEAAGAKVVILEAENRIGGRLYTLRNLPGAPEAGGISIGTGYHRLLRVANELGVELKSGGDEGAGVNQRLGNLYHVNGITVPTSGWADSPANRLVGEERAIEPARLERFYHSALPNLGPREWMDVPAEQDISIRQALINAGASGEARRLMEVNFNGIGLDAQSQLHIPRNMSFYRTNPGASMTIVGGSQALPEAIAASLSETPRLSTPVRGIEEHADMVTLHTDNGTLQSRHVICTVPFAALQSIPIRSPQLSASLARMIVDLPYTRNCLGYIAAKTPFWREDGLPETVWTDDPLVGRIYVLGDDPPMLKLWLRMPGGDQLDRMTLEDAAAAVIPRIEAIRPAAKGQLELLQIFSWQRSPYARGCYYHIGTGMAQDLAEATRFQGRRLHFGGEHMAQFALGMEGAVEAGEIAAQQVLERL